MGALRLSGLLHDLGRVAVSTGTWERRGSLSTGEWEQLRLHAYFSERILSRSDVLAPLARLVGLHHERLDGSGYHRGASAAQIDTPARILAAADVCQALSEPRPHRPARSPSHVAAELERMAAERLLDREVVWAVCEAAGQPRRHRRGDHPSGLSEREIEIVRHLTRGETKRAIAQLLHISPSTVNTHVVHIYEKTGVSTRAGLALFAMEEDLIRDSPREESSERSMFRRV